VTTGYDNLTLALAFAAAPRIVGAGLAAAIAAAAAAAGPD
jgi:hypothetical protein